MPRSVNRFLSILGLVAVVFTIGGCAQAKLDMLSGRWRLFWINDLADPNIYVWKFEEGQVDVIKYPPNGDPFVISTAKYETNAEFIDAVITISDLRSNGQPMPATPFISEGEWTIIEIDEEVMRLDTKDQGGHVIREFVRVK